MKLFSFFKKDFVKNVLTLASGSFISQVLVYLSLLILVRIYSTEMFGVYMLFSSSILILKPLISLQYELAIVLPKKNSDAINVFGLSILVTLLLSIFLLIIIILFKKPILSFFNIEKLAFVIYFIPFSSLMFGFINTYNYWNNRMENFKNIAVGNITKSTFMSFGQLTLGFLKIYNGLISGMIFGQVCQFLFLAKKSSKSIIALKSEISLIKMVDLSKKYKDIPIFNTILSFSNTLSNEIPVLLITKFFDISSAGIYGLAIKIGRAPIGIIQDSVKQVFFNKASNTYNEKENLQQIVKDTIFHLCKFSSIIFIPLFFVSYFLGDIFGEKWVQTGIYLRILIPWLFFMFLSSPLTSLIVILNKQKVILFYDIFLLIFRFLSFYIGYTFYNDILISLIMFSGVGVFFNVLIIFYFYSISKRKNNKLNAYE